MAPYTCWCFLLILTCGLCKTEAAEEHYKKISIPPDYWQLLSSMHCSMPDCSFFCLMDRFCHAFVHDKAENKCELGSIDILDSKFVPKYYPEGKQILIKESKMKFKAEKGHWYVSF